MKNVEDKKSVLQVLKEIIPYIFKGAPLMFIYMQVVSIIYSLLWVAIVPANKVMFDSVMQGVQGKAEYRDIVISILTVFFILIAQQFFN